MDTEPGRPGISVVVPVRGRVERLLHLLESLVPDLEGGREPVEILVVDDSSPHEADLHRANCVRMGARYVRGPRHVGAKRNLGARLAVHDLVYFTDSDCRVQPGTLRALADALRPAPPHVVGAAGPTLVEDSDALLFRIMWHSSLLNGDLEKPQDRTEVAWATTSNLMVRRAALLAIGGFVEESLTVVAGEDVDFGLRLTADGSRIVCVPQARVVHSHLSTSSLKTVGRRLFTYGRSEQWLITRHPDHGRPKFNHASALAVATVTLAGLPPRARRRGARLLPPAAALLMTARLARELRTRRAPVTHTAARVLIEYAFEAGAFVASLQLRRPALLFKGFHATDGHFPDAGREPDAT
ncbi:glycosyltransferase [Streptomyces sp. NBC_00059]|uniref:glycosyltransferase n=1 Tax=Streptomyces sp. NBC_00059 TaxID=2975635 RepID=UPI00225283C1|nr:glycosyltransferase [Streptomyces sp. NBC_00059]MCX5416000.1 glycosyltransferase [Streptomyces sp. NBC_00059]